MPRRKQNKEEEEEQGKAPFPSTGLENIQPEHEQVIEEPASAPPVKLWNGWNGWKTFRKRSREGLLLLLFTCAMFTCMIFFLSWGVQSVLFQTPRAGTSLVDNWNSDTALWIGAGSFLSVGVVVLFDYLCVSPTSAPSASEEQ